MPRAKKKVTGKSKLQRAEKPARMSVQVQRPKAARAASLKKSIQPKPALQKTVQPKPALKKSVQPEPALEKSIRPKPTPKKSIQPKPGQRKRGWRDIEAISERARLKKMLVDIWHEDIELDDDIFGETDHLSGYYTDFEEAEVEIEVDEDLVDEVEEFEEKEE